MNYDPVQIANELIKAADKEIGEGKSAKVFVDPAYPNLCYKIIYQGLNANTPEEEAAFLDEVYELTNGEMDTFRTEKTGTPKTEATFYFKYPESQENEICSVLIMQRIYGMTLQEIMDQRRFPVNVEPLYYDDFLELRDSFQSLRKLVKTMNEQLGIYHNDLSPRNIMLDHIGNWWVIDFGEATKEYFQQKIKKTDVETLKNTWYSFAAFTQSYLHGVL